MTHQIITERQTKAYLHPIRMKIMGNISKKAMTISQVAKEIGVHPANITHHFKILLNAKLIKLVEERDIGRNIEKYYLAIASHFDILPPEGTISDGNKTVLAFFTK